MHISKDKRQFELQIFNGKEYRMIATGTRRDLETPFKVIRGLPRRLVLTEKAWPARPRYRVPVGIRSSGRTSDQICREYIDWAFRKGLSSIATYEGDRWTNILAGGVKGMAPRPVKVSDFLGPAPEAELEPGPESCGHGSRAVVTCGNCGRSWCDDCDPAPAAHCHWCTGRGHSIAPRYPTSNAVPRS